MIKKVNRNDFIILSAIYKSKLRIITASDVEATVYITK